MSAPLRDLAPAERKLPFKAESEHGRHEVDSLTKKPFILPSSPLVPLAGILLGSIEQFIFNLPLFAQALWTIALIGAGFPVVWRTLRAARHGNYATDVVASLSIVTAAIIGQPLAGLVIVLMQTGGEALERFRGAARRRPFGNWRKRPHVSRISSPELADWSTYPSAS